ncbi:MAG: hypothetical protein IJ563_08375, partial [Selenomonadaceae bacterium]|nr:hypothetical protein [Selenomonadaceae bacterium]
DKQTITLKDAKGKKITVNDSEGNISSQIYGDTNIKISDGDGQTVNASLNPTAVTLDGTSRTTDLNLIANAKANVIYLGAGHTTVTAGKGNDTITSSDGTNVFVYNLNDGADVITDYAVGQDVIQLGSGVALTKAATVKGTNDVLLSVTKGSIRFKDGVGKKITIMDADGNTTNQTYGVQSINIADDDDSTINTTIDAMIETINASTRTKDVNIIGNAKNNTIIGGSGNDELFGGKGKDVFVYNGGNDIISDYTAGQDIVQLDSVSITSAAYTGQNGTDLVLNTDKGTLTIENVIKLKSNKGTITKVLPPQKVTIIDKDGINVGAQVYGADYASTINVVNADGAIIKANLDVDVINAAKRSTTVELIGNDKDNTLIGGTKNDTFVYTGGNDVITNYNPKQKDVIELKDTTLSTYHIDGKDVVLELANGKTLTVNNGKGQTITFVDSDGNSTSDTALYNDYNEKVLTNTDAAKFEATIDSRIITIDASKRDTKHAIEIIGNAQDNTIYGGKGNDTLAGGSGADFFVYVNGSGKDVITDYEVGADVIQLGAKTTISKAVAVDDDFVFTIGKGSITVKDGANKIINVIDADGTKLAYNYNYVASRNFVEDVEPEVLADDNFASDNVDNLIPQTSNTAVSLTNLNIDYTSINVDNKYQSTLVSYNN